MPSPDDQDQEEARKAKVDAVIIRGAAGSFAGITACIILQPLETIKTHMQGLALSQKGARPGLIATSRSLVKAKGVSALWRGMGASSLRAGIGQGLYFVLVGRIAGVVQSICGGSPNNERAVIQGLVTGAATRAIAASLLNPLSVLKTKLEWGQGAVGQSTSLAMATSRAIKAEGVQGLFRGLGPTLARDVPYSSIYLALYEAARFQLAVTSGKGLSPVETFLVSAVCSSLATAVTHPFDVIRASRQLQIGKVSALRVLLVGVWPRVLRRTIQIAWTWTLVEEAMKMFECNWR